MADDDALDPAFKALALGLPSEEEIIAHLAGAGQHARPAGGLPGAPRRSRRRSRARSATGSSALYAGNAVPGPYSPDAAPPGAGRCARGRWRS